MPRLIALLVGIGWLAGLAAGVMADPPQPDELFFPPVPYETATEQHIIRLGDLNNDGNDDLVLTDRDAEEVSVWLGSPDGTFSFQTTVSAAGRPLALNCADFNNDDNLDVVVSLEVIDETQVFLGDGAGNITPLAAFPSVSSIGSVAPGDFDEDGNVDLVVSGIVGGAQACFFLGVGDGTFTACNCYGVGSFVAIENFVVHDFNFDSYLDVAVCDTNGGAVYVLIGDGTCNFVVGPAIEPSCLTFLGGIHAGYLNDDPYLDFVSMNNNDSGYAVFLADPDNPVDFFVTDYCNLPGWDSPAIACIDDFDGDGINDIAVPDYGADAVIMLKGNGDGTFIELTRYPISDANNCKSGDFDHDGRADLAVGTYIGGGGLTWVLLGLPNASLTSITDVPNDQGRFVRIRFEASERDAAGSPTPILQYEAYRRIDPLARTAARIDALRWVGEAQPISAHQAALREAGWEFAGAIPAHGELDYSMIARTLVDSTEADGIRWSTFFIRAATSDPLEYFDSAADSGYSIDNLPPGVPGGFRWFASEGYLVFEWDPVEDEDLDHYSLYRSQSDVFDETAELIDEPRETTDSIWIDGGEYPYYFVTAADFSGNDGGAAGLMNGPVGADNVESVPGAYVLAPAHPNPFRSQTVFGFDLPAAGEVQLRVYDVNGRQVASLASGSWNAGRHSVVWDARSSSGTAVSPGIYFVRLAAGDFNTTRRVVVVR